MQKLNSACLKFKMKIHTRETSPSSEKSCLKWSQRANIWLSRTHFTVFRNQWNQQSYFCHMKQSLVVFYFFTISHLKSFIEKLVGRFDTVITLCLQNLLTTRSKNNTTQGRFSRDILKQTTHTKHISVSYMSQPESQNLFTWIGI